MNRANCVEIKLRWWKDFKKCMLAKFLRKCEIWFGVDIVPISISSGNILLNWKSNLYLFRWLLQHHVCTENYYLIFMFWYRYYIFIYCCTRVEVSDVKSMWWSAALITYNKTIINTLHKLRGRRWNAYAVYIVIYIFLIYIQW